MKSQITLAAIPLLALAALAQTTPPQTPATPAPSTATPTATSAGKSSNHGEVANQLQTQSFSGTLVAASCAASSATTAATSSETGKPAAKGTGEASRAANMSDPGPGCAVSSSTAQFALKTKDGHTLKLDDVGNQRVQEAMKTNKKWSGAATSGAPIHVKASGVMTGEQLVVLAIH